MTQLIPATASVAGGFTPAQDQSVIFDGGAKITKGTEDENNAKELTINVSLYLSKFGTTRYVFGNTTSLNTFHIFFDSSDRINVGGGAANINGNLISTQVFRDVGWYNIHVIYDSAQATSSNRLTVEVNGEPIEDWSTETYPTLNTNNPVLISTGDLWIGANDSGTASFEGGMSDFNLIPGIVSSSVFVDDFPFNGGTIKKTKRPSGINYGTGGFRLEFGDSFDFGVDTSPNNADLTATGFVATDQITDVPGNPYAVLSSIDKGPNVVVSDGGLHCTLTNDDKVKSSLSFPYGGDGSFAAEGVAGSSSKNVIGVVNQKYNVQSGTYNLNGVFYHPNGQVHSNGVLNGTYATYTTNDVIEVLTDSSFVWFKKNGVDIYGDSDDKTGGVALPTDSIDLFFAAITSSGTAGAIWDFDFGQRGYTPPVGYTTLKASNLPTPEYYGGDVFGINLRTGTGSAFSVTGSGSRSDLVWSKSRSASASHVLSDSVRGVGLNISSDSTATEVTDAQAVTSFDVDGFSGGTSGTINTAARTYVDWMFKAGGSSVSNTDGTITSQVSAAPEGHFSIASFTGNETQNETYGHGLGGVPEFVIAKARNGGTGWACWHKDLTNASYGIFLNSNAGENNPATDYFEPTLATDLVMGLGANDNTNDSGPMVTYNFRSIPGLCKVGSYVGNGSSDGPFISCGFKTRWAIFKRIDASGSWWIYDTERDTLQPIDMKLRADWTDAELTASHQIYFTANGLKLRMTNSEFNANGGQYIYLAIAEEAGGGELPLPLAR